MPRVLSRLAVLLLIACGQKAPDPPAESAAPTRAAIDGAATPLAADAASRGDADPTDAPGAAPPADASPDLAPEGASDRAVISSLRQPWPAIAELFAPLFIARRVVAFDVSFELDRGDLSFQDTRRVYCRTESVLLTADSARSSMNCSEAPGSEDNPYIESDDGDAPFRVRDIDNHGTSYYFQLEWHADARGLRVSLPDDPSLIEQTDDGAWLPVAPTPTTSMRGDASKRSGHAITGSEKRWCRMDLTLDARGDRRKLIICIAPKRGMVSLELASPGGVGASLIYWQRFKLKHAPPLTQPTDEPIGIVEGSEDTPSGRTVHLEILHEGPYGLVPREVIALPSELRDFRHLAWTAPGAIVLTSWNGAIFAVLAEGRLAWYPTPHAVRSLTESRGGQRPSYSDALRTDGEAVWYGVCPMVRPDDSDDHCADWTWTRLLPASVPPLTRRDDPAPPAPAEVVAPGGYTLRADVVVATPDEEGAAEIGERRFVVCQGRGQESRYEVADQSAGSEWLAADPPLYRIIGKAAPHAIFRACSKEPLAMTFEPVQLGADGRWLYFVAGGDSVVFMRGDVEMGSFKADRAWFAPRR